MTIQDQIRQVAKEFQLDLTQQQITRLAGTLRFSQIRAASNFDPLLRKEIQRLLEQTQKELPTVEANAETPEGQESAFQQIDASLASGNCPRCGKKMRKVALADYTPALFCEGECHITLWQPEQD